MSKPQTVQVTIDVPYTDKKGAKKARKCVATLSFSLDTKAISCLEKGSGKIAVLRGAVMPVDDHPQGVALQQAA